MHKPFSQACEKNKIPIFECIKNIFSVGEILEIGSGTGQHAVYFSKNLPNIIWQTSDVKENHEGIKSWTCGCKNILLPLEINVAHEEQHIQKKFNGVYTANTCHIMSWEEVCLMFSLIKKVLDENADLCIYGPFKYDGKFTSESNCQFNASLQHSSSHMGIRNFEDVVVLGKKHGLSLKQDYAMPANNRLLHFRVF